MVNEERHSRVRGLKALRSQLPLVLKRIIKWVAPTDDDLGRVVHAMGVLKESVKNRLEIMTSEINIQAAPSVWMRNFAASGKQPTEMILPKCQFCKDSANNRCCIYYRWTPPKGVCYMKSLSEACDVVEAI